MGLESFSIYERRQVIEIFSKILFKWYHFIHYNSLMKHLLSIHSFISFISFIRWELANCSNELGMCEISTILINRLNFSLQMYKRKSMRATDMCIRWIWCSTWSLPSRRWRLGSNTEYFKLEFISIGERFLFIFNAFLSNPLHF